MSNHIVPRGSEIVKPGTYWEWIPVEIVPGLSSKVEVLINVPQFETILAWADRTADDPDLPRSLEEVFPEVRERLGCYKLIEKGILVEEDTPNGPAYVMGAAARAHVNHHRDRDRSCESGNWKA
jgi:hypothetical protein